MPKSIEEILVPRSDARLRIYAYEIEDGPHEGLLKVGQTVRDVKTRVAEQLKTPAIKNYKIVVDESAELEDGGTFKDRDVRQALKARGFENPELEWMRCTADDVKAAITALRTGRALAGTHHETFEM